MLSLKRSCMSLSLSLLSVASCGSQPGSDSVAICRAEHPLTQEASSDWVVTNVAERCEADSGECKAREARCMGVTSCEVFDVPCTGAAEDRACDVQQLMSAEAAKCVAQAQGLELGLDGLHARIDYDDKCRRVVWIVQNTLWEDTGFGRRWSGDELSIDAVDGAICKNKDSYVARW